MPTSDTIVQRLGQIERELTRAVAEYPAESALNRVKFVRAMARLVISQIELDDEATVPVLDTELQPKAEYLRR